MLAFAAAQAAETALPPPSDAKDLLEEVVVTAEKRESTVQKTPLSITAISGSDLHARGLSSAQDVVQAVPAIGFYLGETPITPPATATTGKSAIDPDLYDLARVEVLREPQGTLYQTESKLMQPASRLLVRQTHDERQGDIKSRDVLVVEMANMPSNSFAPDRDRLIGHHLRFHP
jgi:hypothetical protein